MGLFEVITYRRARLRHIRQDFLNFPLVEHQQNDPPEIGATRQLFLLSRCWCRDLAILNDEREQCLSDRSRDRYGARFDCEPGRLAQGLRAQLLSKAFGPY
jgi:hypothetical protein